MKARTAVTTALTVALLTTGALAAPQAQAAPANDSVNLTDNSAPTDITVFPQGSSLIGPVNISINNVIVDAGDVTVILDSVALLSQVVGPIK